MIEVSSYEAKTHLAELLRKVGNGERVLITKHQIPVAILSPVPGQKSASIKDTIEALKKYREGNTLGSLNLKDLIDEGRR
jgi:prevent-host-death family protein